MKRGLGAVVLCGLLVAGAVGAPTSAQAAQSVERPSPSRVVAADEFQLDVPADAGWVDTGAFIWAGSGFTITAAGSWTPGPPEAGWVGPQGSETL